MSSSQQAGDFQWNSAAGDCEGWTRATTTVMQNTCPPIRAHVSQKVKQTDRWSLYYSNCEASALFLPSPFPRQMLNQSQFHCLTSPYPQTVNPIGAPPSLICQSSSVGAACQMQMVNGNENLMDGHISLHTRDAADQTPAAISTYYVPPNVRPPCFPWFLSESECASLNH